MTITSVDTSAWAMRTDYRAGRSPEAPSAIEKTPARPAAVDSFDEADSDFDFEAAQRATAATLRRDMQQAMLAEMADARAQGSVSLQTAMAAYSELED